MELQAQISRAQERTREARGRLEQPDVRSLLASIEQSLKSVEILEDELGKRFEQDLEKTKQVESDLLVESNLRANMERQRALFNSVVNQLKEAQFAGDFNSIRSEIIEPANSLRRPVSPRISLILAMALVLGCLVGSGAALLAQLLNQRLRTPEELRTALGYIVIGQIPRAFDNDCGKMGEFGLVSLTNFNSPWAEAFKVARTNLEFLRRNRHVQVVLVTSPYPGDGKSVSSSNLAICLANAGRRVLLIDADLRKPSQHLIHSLASPHGLTDILMGQLQTECVIQRSSVENLDLIAFGSEVSNPSELLLSKNFGAFIEQTRQYYDYMIIDSSPLLSVTDPSIIGAMVDGVVLVVRLSVLRRQDAVKVTELLSNSDIPVLGTLINGVGREHSVYGYDYDYGYGYGNRANGSASPCQTVEGAAEGRQNELVVNSPLVNGGAVPFGSNGTNRLDA